MEVPIRRNNDSGINRPRSIRTKGIVFPFLQETEKLDLGAVIQVTDLIKKQCASCGFLNQPAAIAICSGKGASFVAKERISKYVIIQPCYVDRYKVPLPFAEMMDHSRDHFRPPCRPRSLP